MSGARRIGPGWRTAPPEPADPPTLLYHAARRRAYPVIVDKGLLPAGRPFVPLAVTAEMALRLGRRRDPDPVLLTIQAARSSMEGVVFLRPLEHIYLVEAMPPRFIQGPPLPKEQPAAEKKRKPEPPARPPTPGSFFLEPEPLVGKDRKRKKGDEPDWKRASRKERREKR